MFSPTVIMIAFSVGDIQGEKIEWEKLLAVASTALEKVGVCFILRWEFGHQLIVYPTSSCILPRLIHLVMCADVDFAMMLTRKTQMHTCILIFCLSLIGCCT